MISDSKNIAVEQIYHPDLGPGICGVYAVAAHWITVP